MWLRGQLAAYMKTTITDPRIKGATKAELEITYMFMTDAEDRFFGKWESLLGITWTREDAERMFGGESDKEKLQTAQELLISKFRFPLALILRPELYKEIRMRFGLGDYSETNLSHMVNPDIPEDAQSLFNRPKEEFLRFLGKKPLDNGPLDARPNNRGDFNTDFKRTLPSSGRR